MQFDTAVIVELEELPSEHEKVKGTVCIACDRSCRSSRPSECGSWPGKDLTQGVSMTQQATIEKGASCVRVIFAQSMNNGALKSFLWL